MRLRLVTAFCAGFACGLMFLSVLLWQSGRLRTINSAVAATSLPQSRTAPEPVSPALPEPPPIEAKPTPLAVPEAAPEIPPEQPPNPRSTRPKLIIPVLGVHAKDLRDNFAEMRGGHRHEALDIMAPRGTPVVAADEGNVVKLFLSKPGGLTVYQFDNTRTYCYYYAHLDRYAAGLQEGMFLKRGDVLGYVGSSGDASATAPHLHFAIFKLGPEQHWWQGTAIDPYGFLTGSGGE